VTATPARRFLWRTLFAGALGRRLPTVEGTLDVPGLGAPVTVRRDRYGVPHIDAANDSDAWFGLGFCQAQDRSFQLEGFVRIVRGTLAALVGPDAVGIDRLARRLGFRRNAEAQLGELDRGVARALVAFAHGATEGSRRGAARRAHEFALLRAAPTPYTPADVLGVSQVMGLFLSANWLLELARLRVLASSGPETLAALHPGYEREHAIELPAGASIAPAAEQLVGDAGALLGGGSNAWALAPSRTRSGRALVANDVHLEPTLPNAFYLAHVTTPEWAVAGAALVGTPAVATGHNGAVAWGITAALVDNTDLFIEQVSGHGGAVRGARGLEDCERRREVIEVRGRESVVCDVIVTPRGPIVGYAPDLSPFALSMAATWLAPRPLGGLLEAHRARTCAQLRAALGRWPSAALNVVMADASGSIGWQLAGDVPRRRSVRGTVPQVAWRAGAGWEDAPAAFEDLPGTSDPPDGFVATANDEPAGPGSCFLGDDWVDSYRKVRIAEVLAGRDDWDARAARALQMDVASLPWRELRAHILAAPCRTPDGRRAQATLAWWDGRVAAGSSGATVFELVLSELLRRAAAERVGRDRVPVPAITLVSAMGSRPVGTLVEMLAGRSPRGFERPAPETVADALDAVGAPLRERLGTAPWAWAWGALRPLTLRHPVGRRRPLNHVFDLGPWPYPGDANTVAQAATPPLQPLGNPMFVASMRMVVEVGAWDDAGFVLAGGQSGNPWSAHYGDQVDIWRRGEAATMAWSRAAVERATTRTLTLLPSH
jgi:penicillin G amidase